ncbi:hypothetical protein [Hufsiella ginkgonis]|uniref:Uncharacterized protein n=1 Tax=Hufsiella ginkgonis TaxID=2695274 RepID=A0A7K1Y0L9_9SPHI|nr:hypothetical protein [Hufsiella ginkgonis]MXV16824.1 hypothetical protein [Hufsiella ginkgonis]
MSLSEMDVSSYFEPPFEELQSIVNLLFTFEEEEGELEATAEFERVKYGMHAFYNWEADDSQRTMYELAFKFLLGTMHDGVPAGDGQQYPGKREILTDGCGNFVLPRCTHAIFTVATNGNPLVGGSNPVYITWPQLVEMYEKGWSISDHQWGGTAVFGGYENRYQQVEKNLELIYDEMKSRGVDVRVNAGVVPNNDPGYVSVWAHIKDFAGMSSQGFGTYANDGYPIQYMADSGKPPGFGNLQKVYDAIDNGDPILLARVFWENSLTLASDAVDGLAGEMAAHPDQRFIIRCGSHGPTYVSGDPTEWNTWKAYMNKVFTLLGDKICFASTQETCEYMQVTRKVIKTETINEDGTLTVQLDYTGVPAHYRWQDITLKLTANKTIAGITQTGGARIEKDVDTGIVNIIREITSFADPSLEVDPPEILAANIVTGSANKINLTLSEPVLMSVFSAFRIADTVENQALPSTHTVTGLEGSGTSWRLVLGSNVVAGESVKLYYSMQTGDVRSVADSSRKLPAYWGAAVNNTI